MTKLPPNGHAHEEGDLPAALAKPARRALAQAGYSRLEQFTAVTEAEVLELHGMGRKGLDLIREALAANGQSSATQRSA